MPSAIQPSRIVKVSASLLLSTTYFVAALGVWMVQQGKIDSSADASAVTTHQTVSLFSTYSPAQQVCVKQQLGNARYDEVTAASAASSAPLTAMETTAIQTCLGAQR